ncbi:MAG: hypothetical protein H5T63_05180, partial [Chloroflexi bacterium]|nr:hypothetical protein [Chloroflexota bacterium]
MSYIPNTEADRAAMLKAIGVNNIDELFRDVPEALRYPELKLPPPLSEMEILRELREISAAIRHCCPCKPEAGMNEGDAPARRTSRTSWAWPRH